MTRALPDSSFTEKWGNYVAGYGFTTVPNLLLVYRKALRLSPTEVLVIIAIESFRWTASEPWPSLATLEIRSGFSPRQLRRTISRLEDKNLITRIARPGRSNAYDLLPLIGKLNDVAGYDLPGLPFRPYSLDDDDWRDRST